MDGRVSAGTLGSAPDRALGATAKAWFAVAVLGQWIFATYVAVFYGGSALKGRFETWNKVLPKGYVPGAMLANAAIALHLFFALVILVGGPLQLWPRFRARYPAFHRVNGRIYLATVGATSLAGLYMVWIRGGAAGDLVQHLGISLDAVLILVFAALALRHAMARDFDAHRRWALRLFMVVSAVWFFRIGLTLWILIFRAPVGFDPKTFTGPFLNVLTFAQYLLPLAVLELYLRAKDRAGRTGRVAMAVGLGILTLTTAAGIFAATLMLWLPHL